MLDQGFEQFQAGRFEDAIEAFTACLAVDPETAPAVMGRAIARFQIKDWKAAEQDFRRAGTLDPQNPENGVGLGMSLAMQNEIYPALKTLETVLQRFPEYVRGYIQIGRLYIQIGAIPKGREYLNEGLKHRPSPAERRLIEAALAKQSQLDKKRYSRPDFEALHTKNRTS